MLSKYYPRVMEWGVCGGGGAGGGGGGRIFSGILIQRLDYLLCCFPPDVIIISIHVHVLIHRTLCLVINP